jgi:hypothetical protein
VLATDKVGQLRLGAAERTSSGYHFAMTAQTDCMMTLQALRNNGVCGRLVTDAAFRHIVMSAITNTCLKNVRSFLVYSRFLLGDNRVKGRNNQRTSPHTCPHRQSPPAQCTV